MDFEQVKQTVDPAAMGDVAVNVDRLMDLHNEMESLQAVLKDRSAQFKKLSEELVPASMDAAGCSEFVHKSGLRVKVEDFVQASIPKARQTEAFAWLVDNEHGDLIKTELKSTFGRGELERAYEVQKQLSEDLGCESSVSQSVHASTLKAFVREQLASGETLPVDLLGIYQGRVAKVTK